VRLARRGWRDRQDQRTDGGGIDRCGWRDRARGWGVELLYDIWDRGYLLECYYRGDRQLGSVPAERWRYGDTAAEHDCWRRQIIVLVDNNSAPTAGIGAATRGSDVLIHNDGSTGTITQAVTLMLVSGGNGRWFEVN
jgi:hypothetical protein